MNGDALTVLLIALLPAAGNFGGGLASEFLRPSPSMLNRALHVAAGIILAVVAVEVMPEELGSAPSWMLASAFVAGGGVCGHRGGCETLAASEERLGRRGSVDGIRGRRGRPRR